MIFRRSGSRGLPGTGDWSGAYPLRAGHRWCTLTAASGGHGSRLLAPMLAAAGGLPTGAGWAYEFKHDGVRCLAYCSGDGVRLMSRNQNDITRSYPEIAELAVLLDGGRAVLDGEIVALDRLTRPSFALLQQRMHVTGPPPALVAAVPVAYYVFDLLELGGQDLTQRPYAVRRDLLTALELHGRHVRVPSSFVDVDGGAVLHTAEVALLEGVVAKRLASPYRAGKRSSDWTKVPLSRTQEVLVAGWKPGAGRRAGMIGSLLLAVHDDHDRLVFAGHVGTGFTDADLRHLHGLLAPLERPEPTVPGVPRDHARHARWVEPVLVGEVVFRNWTPDGRLRHPSWRGLRSDTTVTRRAPAPAGGVVTGAMQTRDGRWRVEIIRRGREQCYRLTHGGTVLDGLAIATVERLLAEAGADIADLVDVPGR